MQSRTADFTVDLRDFMKINILNYSRLYLFFYIFLSARSLRKRELVIRDDDYGAGQLFRNLINYRTDSFTCATIKAGKSVTQKS